MNTLFFIFVLLCLANDNEILFFLMNYFSKSRIQYHSSFSILKCTYSILQLGISTLGYFCEGIISFLFDFLYFHLTLTDIQRSHGKPYRLL